MLSLAFLGTFHVQCNTTEIHCFRTQSVRTLLAYLAIESDRPHDRNYLATLLWPDLPMDQALTTLRQCIHRLRSVLNDDTGGEHLQITRHTLWLRPESIKELDVQRFESLINSVKPTQINQIINYSEAERLHNAIALYRGELLPGFYGTGSNELDDWLLLRREQIHNHMIAALDYLSDYHIRRGDFYAAAEYLRHWLIIEPWRELAHRRLIGLLIDHGRHAEAIRQFGVCCKNLQHEVGLMPSNETRALVSQMMQYPSITMCLEEKSLG